MNQAKVYIIIFGGLLTLVSPGLAQPVNDLFANRVFLAGSSITTNGSTIGATKEPGEPDHSGNPGGKSVWWSWTASNWGIVTVSTVGSSFDTLLAVYTGTSVSNLNPIVSNDDAGGNLTSLVSFYVTSNTTYQIAVDGYSGAAGNISLSLVFDVPPPPQLSSVPRGDFWVTDGSVYAVLETNGVVYIGGQFNSIAPNGGRGSLVNIYSAASSPLLPQANGSILSVIPDGAGGWFIGGLFNAVGGVPRTNVAHLLADLTVDPNFAPNPVGTTNRVHALLLNRDTLYVGGVFTNIAGQAFSGLAALDRVSGNALPWNASVQGEVYALALGADTLYVGGAFTRIGNQSRYNLAAVSLVAGNVTAWDPAPSGFFPAPTVTAFALDASTLYVGGYFTRIAGVGRNFIAAFDAPTGQLTDWDPNANEGVLALKVLCNTVYAGGSFTSIGGQPRNYLAALDQQTGQATAWNPSASDAVFALIISGNTVYAGGLFTEIGGAMRDSVAALDLASGLANPWEPNADRGVLALALVGDNLFVGGGLSSGGVARKNLAALDAATGRPLPWNPSVRGTVQTLAISNQTLFVGGSFSNLAGQERFCLGAVDTVTGQATAFRADASNVISGFTNVSALSYASGLLYVGGTFTHINGQVRGALAAVNPLTGALAPWNPIAQGPVYSLSVVSNKIYVGGAFTNFGNPFLPPTAVRFNLAEFDVGSNVPTAWNPSVNRPVRALTADATRVYAGGQFTQVGQSNRFSVAAINRGTGTVTPWNPNVQGGLYQVVTSLALVGSNVYVGGNFTSVHGVPRFGLAEVDALTGVPTSWNPRLGDARAIGWSLFASSNKVYCGGDILTVGDEVRTFLALFNQPGYPRIVSHPARQIVSPGQLTSFHVTATGDPPVSYQWQFNGANISGATGDSFFLSAAQLADSGEYSVIVSNTLGATYSLAATLTVLDPVTIVTQPQSQTVSPGVNITLTVEATGNPPPTYQWRLNGVNIPGAVFPSLTLPNAQPADGGSYTVIVDNGRGAVSSDIARVIVLAPALPFADNFADRAFDNRTNATGRGSNASMTSEEGETNHVSKVGGRSVWFGWVAPATGIATFSTRGSGFDTLLAIYTGTNVSGLDPVASDEDRGGFLTSQASFNAVQGAEYSIAIDGFAGATGDIVLSWSLDSSTVEFPRIISQPLGQSVSAGQTVTLEVEVSSPTPVTYQWFHDCRAIAGATNQTLIISNVQSGDVGIYRVLVMNASSKVAESVDALLEIGPQPKVLTHDKLEDLLQSDEGANLVGFGNSPALSSIGASSFITVSMGTVDSQILNNTAATTQQGEPNHCEVLGGASRWFGLRPAQSGVLQVDTIGSAIDTVLAVYTGTNIFNLQLVDCDNNSAPDGIRSLLRFNAAGGTKYSVAIDGVGGAQGVITLGWRLGTRPSITSLQTNQTVRQGEDLTLSVAVTNAIPPPAYQWRLNGTNIVGATNASLTLLSLQGAQAGAYSVAVSNFAGAATNMIALVTVALPIQVSYELLRSNGTVRFRLLGPVSQGLVIEASTNLNGWTRLYTNSASTVRLDFVDTPTSNYPARFYRVVPSP